MMLKCSRGKNKKINEIVDSLFVTAGQALPGNLTSAVTEAMKMAFHYFLAQLEISLCAEGQAGEQFKSWQNVLFFCCQFFFFF